MKIRRISKNVFFLMCVIVLEVICVKAVQYEVLPEKYFYDSQKILRIMNGSTITDKYYSYTANIFNAINIFNFTTLKQWSWFIGITFSLILVIILSKASKYTISQQIFILASVGLMSIYTFNLSKDVIQFVYFLILYKILSCKLSNMKKLVLLCIILMIETIFFRDYYIIMASLIVAIYVMYIIFIKNKNVNKKSVVKLILLSLFIIFLEIFCVKFVSLSRYNSILNVRTSTNSSRTDSIDAVTIIIDPLGKNSNFIIFMGNYLINAIRMMIPIELLFKGIKYVPFIMYQLFILYIIINGIKRTSDGNILWIITIISFLMMSIIFEPDFGSFIRHESTTFLLLLEITKFNQKEILNKKEK